MTRIEDMSQAERYSWVSLIATVGVFWWFWNKFVGFHGLTQYEPGPLLRLYIVTAILTAVSHAGVAAFFVVRGDKNWLWSDDEIVKDERDLAIEQRAEKYAMWFLYAAINIIIVQIMLESVFTEGYEPPVRIMSLSGIVFTLTTSLIIADIIKRVSMIMGYRA